jgi:hypothetical protein
MADSLQQIIDLTIQPRRSSALAQFPLRGTPTSEFFNSSSRRSLAVRGTSPPVSINSRKPGDYVTSEIADEPIVVVRGSDNQIRAFFNACRHHAAAVMIDAQGKLSTDALPLSWLDVFPRR